MSFTGRSEAKGKKNEGRRPGPRLSPCQWCHQIICNHCRCPGQKNCNHAPGEMCPNSRYKRRLVCNPCEKNKLKVRQESKKHSENKPSVCLMKKLVLDSLQQTPCNVIPAPSPNGTCFRLTCWHSLISESQHSYFVLLVEQRFIDDSILLFSRVAPWSSLYDPQYDAARKRSEFCVYSW